ncbi:TPA: hypothetical protein R4K21_003217 [Stenotrophomonas maltophilia]|nr:hypothetical protein [Stenotrophomonas maltophilia]
MTNITELEDGVNVKMARWKIWPQTFGDSRSGRAALSFVTEKSWWAPDKVTGPEFVLELYGQQLAVDFMQWSLENSGEEFFAEIIEAMPRKIGTVERSFLDTIMKWGQCGAQ